MTKPERSVAAVSNESSQPSTGIETLPEQLGQLSSEVSELLNTKFDLLKVELKEEARAYARDAALVGAGGILAAVGFTLLHVRQTRGIGAGYLALGGLGAVFALRQIRSRDPLPEESVAEVKRDTEWLKNTLG